MEQKYKANMPIDKIKLNDLTILIPIRIDSESRLENVLCILQFLNSWVECPILVLEADATEKVDVPEGVTKIFIEDHNPVFYRTRYINQMIRKTDAPYLAVWDADVLLNPLQLLLGVEMLRKNEADMVFPYDGNFYAVPQYIKEVFLQHKDRLEVLEQSIGRMRLMHNFPSVGGGFLVKKKTYIEVGMENENFFGWGLEDAERIKRWEILGCRIKRTNGVMFHLPHHRGTNSWFADPETEISLRKEFLRICSMDQAALKNEVNLWKRGL